MYRWAILDGTKTCWRLALGRMLTELAIEVAVQFFQVASHHGSLIPGSSVETDFA